MNRSRVGKAELPEDVICSEQDPIESQLLGEIENLTQLAEAYNQACPHHGDSMLHLVIESMLDCVILFDRNLHVLETNDAATDTLCLPRGTRNFALTPSIDPGEVRDVHGNTLGFDNSVQVRCINGEYVENWEQHHINKDGTTRYYIVNASPIFNQAGEVIMGLIVARDITELKKLQFRTERMLSEFSRQSNSMRYLINNIPAGVILLDSEKKVLTANKAYMQYFDQPVKWQEGMLLNDLLPQAEESGLVSLLDQALATNRPVSVRNFRYDGFSRGATYWSGSAVPVRLQHGGSQVDGVAIVTVDVSEEITVQQQLKDLAILAERRAAELEVERARLDTIIQSIPVPLVVLDKSLNVIAHNSAANDLASIMGITYNILEKDSHRATPGMDIVDGEGNVLDHQDFPIARSLRGEVCAGFIMSHRIQGASTRTLSVNSAPLKDAKGDVAGVVVAVSDITEQARAQERIKEIYLREHAIAEKLQMSFLPNDLPNIEGFEIGQRYHPARDEAMVGGDFYDIFKLSDNRFGIVMADVAGKGLKSAVYTAMSKYMLRAYALEESSPDDVLTRLNEALSACTPPEVFVTLVYGVLDNRERTFVYANAGHEQPILYCKSADIAIPLDVTGRALALINGAGYITHTVELNSGDVLMLYTDGITDAGWGVNRLGHERVLSLLEARAHLSVPEIADSVLGYALEFAGGKLGDDAALLLIRASD